MRRSLCLSRVQCTLCFLLLGGHLSKTSLDCIIGLMNFCNFVKQFLLTFFCTVCLSNFVCQCHLQPTLCFILLSRAFIQNCLDCIFGLLSFCNFVEQLLLGLVCMLRLCKQLHHLLLPT